MFYFRFVYLVKYVAFKKTLPKPTAIIDIIIFILSYPNDRMSLKALVCDMITTRTSTGIPLLGILQVAVVWAADTAHQICNTIGSKHCHD